MPDLNALFFRMITAAPQNHLTQENAICDPKHTPAYSKNDRPTPKKTPSLTPKAPITATKHQRILPQSYVRPQNTGYVRKTTATPAQNQTRVLSKHHHIINNLWLFPQKHTFSACITEKCNTKYSTEHKIKAKNMNYADRSLHHTYRFRAVSDAPTQKKRNTRMPDRYARPE